jgi:zinc protease
MVDFNSFTLDNGLKILVHEDHSVSTAVLNVLYDVGSRDETEEKTGFAHLFEHLMFGGSINIPNYDEPLQKVGGDNNAFTSPDITNYYITLPSNNIETAFWLESDRMLSLSFDPKVLEVQRSVVIEEFKQQYLNQPYGDVWLKLRPLAYKEHPYSWPTIGKEIKHIEETVMSDVKAFFKKFYCPNNAVMVVAGNVTLDQVKELSEKWFGPIPKGVSYSRNLTKEPVQQERSFLEVEADVPTDALYMTFHMPGRFDENYLTVDLMGDMLGRGKSSRLHDQLVNQERIFNSIGTYVTGSLDPGLFVISGKLVKGVSLKQAEERVWAVIAEFMENGFEEEELTKVKNKAESTLVFSEVDLLSRAMNLAFAEVANKPDYFNNEPGLIQAVEASEIIKQAKEILTAKNVSVLYYKSSSNEN